MIDVEAIILLNHDAGFERGQLPIWTVYDRPSDHPQGFIARLHEVGPGIYGPTAHVVTGELHELRVAFMQAGLTCIARSEGDDANIVESWL